jgi:hypothetical protein
MSSRKYGSCFQKRKKKQRIKNLTQSCKGVMGRFVKESQVSFMNQSVEIDPGRFLFKTQIPNFMDGN